MLWLILASLCFYGWWDPFFVLLLILSVTFNFVIGCALQSTCPKQFRGLLLGFGIVVDLAALGWFKYSFFILENLSALSGSSFSLPEIILPLGISFFTFQQIAYLVDCRRGKAKETNFLNYFLFVTFFPQLIAGPIVHHKEMMPQFMACSSERVFSPNIAIGLTIFAIGLFKKVVIADGLAEFVNPVFDRAAAGGSIDLVSAWGAALSYTFQLYFDFSAYSDMAIGIARMFGIRLPINFFSPYKSTSITDFWRRWHMTLSRFLRDYLYFPLGGNRLGYCRRYVNLMTVMVIGGLWHGAGWTFVFWGALHGLYLSINHAWSAAIQYFGLEKAQNSDAYKCIAWVVTFLSIVVGWVFFRAESFDAARLVFEGMIGRNGTALPPLIAEAIHRITGVTLTNINVDHSIGDMNFLLQIVWISLALLIVLICPNTCQWMEKAAPVLDRFSAASAVMPLWRMRFGAAVLSALMFYAAIRNLFSDVPSEFLYFQF